MKFKPQSKRQISFGEQTNSIEPEGCHSTCVGLNLPGNDCTVIHLNLDDLLLLVSLPIKDNLNDENNLTSPLAQHIQTCFSLGPIAQHVISLSVSIVLYL